MSGQNGKFNAVFLLYLYKLNSNTHPKSALSAADSNLSKLTVLSNFIFA